MGLPGFSFGAGSSLVPSSGVSSADDNRSIFNNGDFANFGSDPLENIGLVVLGFLIGVVITWALSN